MPGTVVTFYSYKGGVGRSFALANIAVLLARWGHRVLCVDWDLEAPGLHVYFRSLMDDEPAGGVVDLVADFTAGRPPGDHRTRVAANLDLVAAGAADGDYVGRVQDIDWARLYDTGFGDFLEQCREQWTADYDYVLVDSRTGVSDTGGICTAHLPDRLVVLFTANLQSIRGAVDIAVRADAARDRMPYDRSQLTVLPVLSRFDTREEYDRADEWRRVCVAETRHLYENWLDADVDPASMSGHLTLPYVSYWSFGEQLPVASEANPAADQISFALETVAAVVARDFDGTKLLVANRDAYVTALRVGNRVFEHELRVSTPRPTRLLADVLIRELGALGVDAVLSLSGDRSMLTGDDDNARHLCLIVDGRLSRWQSAEVELFLYRNLRQDRRIIPILTADTDPNALTGYVGNLRYLRFGAGYGPAEVAAQLAGQLSADPPKATELALTLRRAAGALLRPSRWELVEEIVAAVSAAIAAGDIARAEQLDAELAVVLRPGEHPADGAVPAPPVTTVAIETALAALDARQ